MDCPCGKDTKIRISGATPLLPFLDRSKRRSGICQHHNTRLDLDVDDAAAGALLALMRSYTSTVERMPGVVNFNFPPDMGQNDRVMAVGRRAWLFIDTQRESLHARPDLPRQRHQCARLLHASLRTSASRDHRLLPWNVKPPLKAVPAAA